MSVMFRRALEQHIQQLTTTLENPASADRSEDIARIEALLASSSDGRFKRALNNAKKRLETAAPKVDLADVRVRLDALRQVFLMLKDHPEYAFKRRRRRAPGDGPPRPRGRPRKHPVV